MTVAVKFPRAVAISFTLLMLLPSLPVAAAEHTQELVPDVPHLPHAYPTDQCVQVALPAEILATVNDALAGDTSRFALDDQGVPAICDGSGKPMAEWQALIRRADSLLADFRNQSFAIQNQTNLRLEHTLPGGSRKECELMERNAGEAGADGARTAPATCDVLRPSFTLLHDKLDGRRIGGFGEWTVVTERGEDELFYRSKYTDFNGTKHTYRFGGANGYERGAHQFLVSPELDLSVVASTHEAAQAIHELRRDARNALYRACNQIAISPNTPAILGGVCGANPTAGLVAPFGMFPPGVSPVGALLVQAYERAFDDTVEHLPVMQVAAALEFKYRINMADSEDGVRVWVYVGDEPPTRLDLFGTPLKTSGDSMRCVSQEVPGDPTVANTTCDGTYTECNYADYTCFETTRIAQVQMLDGHTKETQAFTNLDTMARWDMPHALTGDSNAWRTVRINLTDFVPERVWLLFEVATKRPSRSDEPFFGESTVFPRYGDFGFEMTDIHAVAEGYHRNVRVKDVSAHLPRMPPGNDHDDGRDVRATVPPGEPIRVQIQNAGQYLENGTLTVTVRTQSGTLLGTRTLPIVELKPSEVRVLRVPWGDIQNAQGNATFADGLAPGMLVRVTARLDVDKGDISGFSNSGIRPNATYLTDPNNTAIRTPNVAEMPKSNDSLPWHASSVEASQLIRAYTHHQLTIVPPRKGGGSLLVCSEYEIATGFCAYQFTAERGVSRILVTSVRNDGSVIEDAVATLSLTRDGLDQSATIQGEASQQVRDLLPGETRSVQWTIAPAEAGIYQAKITFRVDGQAADRWATVERLVYVQRTPGTICFDDLNAQRLCSPSFAVERPEIFAGREFTSATADRAGTIYATTAVNHTDGGLYARDAEGGWVKVLDLSNKSLTARFGALNASRGYGDIYSMTFGPDGTLYMAGLNGTLLARAPSGDLKVHRAWEGARPVHFLTSAWWNDTLWAAGTFGGLFFLNGTRLDQVNVTFDDNYDPNDANSTLTATFRHLVPKGKMAILAGDYGFLFTSNGSVWKNQSQEALSGAWKPARSPDNQWGNDWGKDHTGVKNRNIRDLKLIGTRVWAIGDQGLMMTSTDGYVYHNATVPTLFEGANLRQIFVTHKGDLYLADRDSRFATCGTCRAPPAADAWEYPAIPVPNVIDALTEDARPARIVESVTTGSSTLLFAEDGVLLVFDQRSDYANQQDWSPVPDLLADKGAIQTAFPPSGAPTAHVAYRGNVTADGQAKASGADRYRVTMRHYVLRASEDNPGIVRLLAAPYPSQSVGLLATTAAGQTCPKQPKAGTTSATYAACNLVTLGSHSFKRPTLAGDWVTTTFEVPAYLSTQGFDGTPAFHGVELYSAPHLMWAVDSIRVDAIKDGAPTTILYWNDLTGKGNLGTWGVYGVETITSAGVIWETTNQPFGNTTNSPWHITQNLADRPVWVANNEIWSPDPATGGAYLLEDWNTRLLSPIIDLSEAYDPVVQFRHAYAFRHKLSYSTANPTMGTYQIADAGMIEVQWERTPDECAADGLPAGCWSSFHKVHPEGGYPSANQAFGPLRWQSTSVARTGADPVGPRTNADGLALPLPGHSFFGRSPGVAPNEESIITAPRFVDSGAYQTVRVALNDQVCAESQTPATGCLPVNLSGRRVRVGFHLVTPHNPHGATQWDYRDPAQDDIRTSFAGEGWYITDFKVLGARQLGVDLRATNVSFRVGYDVDTIGVGPGTTVSVNATVENRGIFDVSGYTGELEVRRVTDPLRKRTELVEVVPLSQQPVLAAGASQNHTFSWRVPQGEDLNYTLTFRATPLGIDRDEDPTDNLALLGTITQPVRAKTVRQFGVEFVVTPENATSDITRYVPIFLNNTGNVPLTDFAVKRLITLLRPGAQPDVQEWRTDRAVPAGTRTPLALVSSEINPTEDLFWKAPERANYVFAVEATTGRLTSNAQRLVAAFATYLFDDVEGGPRGEATRGEWKFDSAWGAVEPGFLTPSSYGFGDPKLKRYQPDQNAAAATPTIDVSGARSAQIAFFHRYKFEPRFDGGLVEASADGGKTWYPLTPKKDTLNDLPFGYNRTLPLSPASALHPNGDPDVAAYGFTGDSCELPAAVDCWVLSQFDLTQLPPIRETNVAYEIHSAVALKGMEHDAFKGVVRNGTKRIGDALYTEDAWTTRPGDWMNWTVENISEKEIRSPVGDDTIWWSGSVLRNDDGLQPNRTYMLTIPVDLTAYATDTKSRIVIDWWEWVDRYKKSPLIILPRTDENQLPGRPLEKDMRAAYAWAQGAPSQAYRFNVTPPVTVERQGQWFHLQSDVTEWRGQKVDVSFVYSPLTTHPSGNSPVLPENVRSDFLLDRGFAIDDFKVVAYQVVNGQPFNTRHILDEDRAWNASSVERCLNAFDASNVLALPCFYRDEGGIQRPKVVNPGTLTVRQNVTAQRATGLMWNLTPSVPFMNVSWQVVNVTDELGSPTTNTGETVLAWWTGDTSCQVRPQQGRNTCLPPGAESRLITPAFDLARVAGSTAKLTFTHRFAFPYEKSGEWHFPLASGGVVEIQELDKQTNKWGPWKQIYARDLVPPDTVNQSAIPYWHPQSPWMGGRGGYTMFTVNDTTTTTSAYPRIDSPFEPALFEPQRGRELQFLYSGNSTFGPVADGKLRNICAKGPKGEDLRGWCPAEFDVSEYLGRTVRFAFHVHMAGHSLAIASQNWESQDVGNSGPNLFNPDGDQYGRKGGWWIRDVAVRGDALKAEPIQVRLRAASDGNVDDGYWQVDDFGVYGSRYAKNVGLFLDQTPNKYGVVSGGSVTVPVTVRNFGDSVRRGLAVELIPLPSDASLKVAGVGPLDPEQVLRPAGTLRFAGYTLAPGQVGTLDLTFTAPSAVSDGRAHYLLRLREFNAGTGQYEPIADNEVQGFLERVLTLKLDTESRYEVARVATSPSRPTAGEPVELRATVRNVGYGPFGLELNCTAMSLSGWRKVDHTKENAESPIVTQRYTCARTGGATVLQPGEWTNVTYVVTPLHEGQLRFEVNGRRVDNIFNKSIAPIVWTAPVGKSPTVFTESFDWPANVSQNWTMENAGVSGWSHLRGHRGVGALFLGINETFFPSGSNQYATRSGCPGGNCSAKTQPVDLHNQTAEGMFLTFWHMRRFAHGDGGDVQVEVLINEERPDRASSWSNPCRMYPVRGYDGPVLSYIFVPPAGSNEPPVTDRNPAHATTDTGGAIRPSPDHYYISANRTWDESWRLAQFDLSEQTCEWADAAGNTFKRPILGHTVRFVFNAYLSDDKSRQAGDTSDGGAFSPIERGAGHGWLIDDVSVGPMAIQVRPELQKATLLDNTTKEFRAVLRNLGDMEDQIRLAYDEGNSSAPAGSVRTPGDAVTLQPGETRQVSFNVTLPRDPSLLPTQYKARVNIGSIFDANAAGRTDLDLIFAPRQWAELAIQVEKPRLAVQEGTEVFIPITVENTGIVPSVPSKVRIVDTYNGVASAPIELELPSMSSYFIDPEDASRVLEFRWRPEKGTVGEHTLTFTVDPLVLGQEYTRTNNEAVLKVPVVKLLIPDLDIAHNAALTLRNSVGASLTSTKDGDVVRYDVTAGDLVTFELRVRNNGQAGATNVDVLASIGSLNLPSKTIPYIAPGSEVIVKFNWLSQKGEYDLAFKVRSEQVEASTVNNDNPAVGVTRLTVKGFEVEVDLDAIDGVHDAGDEIRVPFRLSNSGNAGEEIRLVAQSDGVDVRLSGGELFLREGETIDRVLAVRVPDNAVAGEHVITVQAVSRENPMKVAAAQTTVRVKATYGGAILLSEVEVAPPTFKLPIRLLNDGNSLEPWMVNVRLPAGWIARGEMPARFSVPAFAEVTREITVDAPATTTPGIREVLVTATLPDGSTREGKVLVEIGAVRTAAVRLASGTPRPVEGALAYPVVVENVGNTEKPFEMRLLDVPSGVKAKLTPSVFELPPGGKTVATLLVTPSAELETPDVELKGYTLFEGVQPDTAEGRANVQVLALSIARPDLRVGQADISPRTGIEPGDRVQVKVPVSNRGRTAVTDLPVHLYVDDVFAVETRVTLQPGETRDAVLNWTASPGEHTLTVVVDPYHEAAEADRADNAVSALADVGGAPLSGIAAGSPIPGPGVLGALVALAAAFAVLSSGRRRPPK